MPLLVTYGACSGGLIPDEIASVEVEETQETVMIQVMIRLPPQPFPTTCPENPIIEHTVELDSPVGDRIIEVAGDKGTVVLSPGG